MNIIEEIIYPVLDELKEEEELEFTNSPDLILYGEGDTVLDSLSLVDFLVSIQDKVSEITDKDIVLATPKGACEKKSVNSVFYDYIFTYPAL